MNHHIDTTLNQLNNQNENEVLYQNKYIKIIEMLEINLQNRYLAANMMRKSC